MSNNQNSTKSINYLIGRDKKGENVYIAQVNNYAQQQSSLNKVETDVVRKLDDLLAKIRQNHDNWTKQSKYGDCWGN